MIRDFEAYLNIIYQRDVTAHKIYNILTHLRDSYKIIEFILVAQLN